MKCKKCRKEIPELSKFCNLCGTSQEKQKSTRHKNGAGTYYKRKDGIIEYKVSIGMQADGSPSRISFYGKTEKECRRKHERWQKDGKQTIEKVQTVEVWAVEWLDTYKKGTVSYGTYNNYRMYINNRIIPKLGKMRLSQVRPVHIQQFYKTINKLSKTAQNDIYSALNGIFETAKVNHFCNENPVSKPTIARKTKKQIEVFTVKEIQKIIQSTNKHAKFPQLLLHTGMRIGEAVALKWSHIDLEKGMISVSSSTSRKEGGGWIDGDTKGRNIRTVYLTEDGLNFIKTLPRKGFSVIASESGYQLTPRTFEVGYKKFFEISDMRYLSPHKCRHTYATYLVKGGADLNAVQALLGHSTINITEAYTHVENDNEYLKDNVSKLVFEK